MDDTIAEFFMADTILPRVRWYKYLGIIISAGGGWAKNILRITTKAVSKTAEIRAWCNVHKVPLDLAANLWSLYALRAIIYGSAIMAETDCNTKALTGYNEKQAASY
jgi:hypothetical protein